MVAVDLNIEVFCVDTFRKFCSKIGYDFKYQKTYEVSNPIVWNDSVCNALSYRLRLYLDEWILNYYKQCLKSSIDFYLQFELFMKLLPTINIHLNVFDKLLTLFALGICMHFLCLNELQGDSYNAPLCVAMYFDTEFKKEFYDKGGWEALQIHVVSYQPYAYTPFFLFNKNKCREDSKFIFDAVIKDLYLLDLVEKNFKDLSNNKNVCRFCYPLSRAMMTTCGVAKGKSNYATLEGYLQLIMRLLTTSELLQCAHNICFEISDSDEDETYFHEKVRQCFQLRIEITRKFLSRLFKNHDHSNAALCSFCGGNISDLSGDGPSVTDYRIEKIKFVFNETKRNVYVQSREATTASVEKWLSIIRVEKSKSEMLNSNKNKRKSKKVEENDSQKDCLTI